MKLKPILLATTAMLALPGMAQNLAIGLTFGSFGVPEAVFAL